LFAGSGYPPPNASVCRRHADQRCPKQRQSSRLGPKTRLPDKRGKRTLDDRTGCNPLLRRNRSLRGKVRGAKSLPKPGLFTTRSSRGGSRSRGYGAFATERTGNVLDCPVRMRLAAKRRRRGAWGRGSRSGGE